MNTKQIQSSKKLSSRFAIVFLCASLLSLALSYFVFGPTGKIQISNIHISANSSQAILLAQTPVTQPGLDNRDSGILKNPIGTQNGTLVEFLNMLLGVIIMIGSIVIVFSIILAGFKYITAQGNSELIVEAHRQLFVTSIGAAVLLGARVIMAVIQNTVQTLSF